MYHHHNKQMVVILLLVCDHDCYKGIKTHGSESWGQEEAGLRDERVSYLQVALL